jgi:glycerol uptake facilitator-like aquaporin
MIRKYFAEVIGTFGSVFTSCGAIIVYDLYDGALGHIGTCCLVFGLFAEPGALTGGCIGSEATGD